MMNYHELIDITTIRLSALLLGESTFFARSVDAAPLVDVTTETTPPVDEVGDPSTAGRCDVAVDTPLGAFETAYLPWQWLGPEHPTLVYHHGSGERPFDLGRFSTNSFRRLFLGLEEELSANLVAVRAPFHDGSSQMFVSSVYRYITADAALRQPSRLRDVLDFDDAFRAIEADTCAPLLGRYDRIVEYDRHRPSYTGMSLAVLDRGHVTGSLAAAALRQHVLGAVPETNDGADTPSTDGETGAVDQ